MAGSFFVPDGQGFQPTELCRGPWDPDSQHAGPPAALIGHAIDALHSEIRGQVGRVTFEILRPVPLARLRVEARIARPGRSVEMVEAALRDEEGEVMIARAWRLRTTPLELPSPPDGASAAVGPAPGKLDAGHVPPGPERGRDVDFLPTGQEVGYHTAMEYRFVAGAFREPGPATAWMRMRHPLIEGEVDSPLTRVLIAADSGNGVSASLDWRRWLFVNVDLTVHLHRLPEGEWVCLDSVTLPEANGIGLADTALYDVHGPIGRSAQTLLVAPR
jgi:hypothetical protein